MKNLLKLEELALLALSLFLISQLDYSLWWTLLIVIAPDVGMLGYLINSKIGAWSYNFFHHRGVGILFYFIGVIIVAPLAQFTGLIILGHASLDRIFGYGLKYSDSFQNTHLGKIGNQ